MQGEFLSALFPNATNLRFFTPPYPVPLCTLPIPLHRGCDGPTTRKYCSCELDCDRRRMSAVRAFFERNVYTHLLFSFAIFFPASAGTLHATDHSPYTCACTQPPFSVHVRP